MLGGVLVSGGPVPTGWEAPHGPPPEGGALDQMTDVSGTAAGAPGSALTKGADGVWRPGPGVAAHNDDDGAHPSLQASIAVAEAGLLAHVASPSPHPEYDDSPSFRLLFENGLP